MSRKQRVVFRCDIEIVIESPWSGDCSIKQVMEQAEDSARKEIERLRGHADLKRVHIAHNPRLVRVILDEVTP